MTLIVLEGPSRSGKSTVRDRLMEEHPEWVMWKGENLMRKGVGDSWIDYRERYHEALHRLYELNPENVIIADRGFSDSVYNSDNEMREEFRRLAACYGDVYIMYFYPGQVTEVGSGIVQHDDDPHEESGKTVLRERGTRDAPKLGEILHEYEKLLRMFPFKHIDTEQFTVEESVGMCLDQIEEWTAEEHDPDV